MATPEKYVRTGTRLDHEQQRDVSRLLAHHFGDGLIYLQNSHDREVLRLAQALGLVSEEGYLTQAGYAMWQRQNT